jgi:hypothetical protein
LETISVVEAKWLEVEGLKRSYDRKEGELQKFHFRYGNPDLGPLIVPAEEFVDAATREQELLRHHHDMKMERDAIGRQLQAAMKELSELRK